MSVKRADQPGKAIVARVIEDAGEIATLPEVMARVIEVTEDPESGANELFEVIRRDAVLSSRLLRVVNSAFYGLPGQVADVDRAITLLGMVQVRDVALASSVSEVFRGGQDPRLFDTRMLWRHSVAVSVAARTMARIAGDAVGAAEAFLIGLIHDIGLLFVHQVLPDQLAEVLERCDASKPGDLLAAERSVIGATHEEFGEALITRWKFPARVRSAIGRHHDPQKSPDDARRNGMILYCADTLSSQVGLGIGVGTRHQELGEAQFSAAGITPAQAEALREELPGEVEEMLGVLDNAA